VLISLAQFSFFGHDAPQGYHAETSETYICGTVDKSVKQFVEVVLTSAELLSLAFSVPFSRL